jgi:hypothetical protein
MKNLKTSAFLIAAALFPIGASASKLQREAFNFMGSTSDEETAGRIRMATVNMNA